MKVRTILLVEDNPDDEELTLQALHKANVSNSVVVVRDGAEALDYLFATGPYAGRNRADLPAVMLLDLKLPKISGLEVLRRVRADVDLRVMPVVILTSSSEEQDIVNGYRNGCNSYIRKPVNFQRFVEAVAHVGLYWLVLNEPLPAVAALPTRSETRP